MGGDRAAVLSQARAALAEGKVLEAVGLLEDRLAHESDPDALRLLGEARHRLGDLGGAGAVWFATNAKGPIIDEAIEAWRTEYDDDFAAMWDSLPEGVKSGPLSPRLAALRHRAGADEPADVAEPTAMTAMTAAADADDAVAPTEAAEQVSESEPTRAPTSALPSRPEPEELLGEAERSRRPEPPSRVVPDPEAAREVRPRRAPDSDPEPEPQPRRRRGSEELTPVIRDRRAATDRPEESSDGFDAAKVIAWILAALFVVCAVVGLITILQWIVPG